MQRLDSGRGWQGKGGETVSYKIEYLQRDALMELTAWVNNPGSMILEPCRSRHWTTLALLLTELGPH